MARWRKPFAAFCLASSTGCAGARSPAKPESSCKNCTLSTDALSYVATPIVGEGALVHKRYHFTLISRFENRSRESVFLATCNPDSKEPLFTVVGVDSATAFDSATEPAYATVWGCVGHDRQIEVGPGLVRIDTLEIQGPNSFNGHTGEPHGKTEGTFRLYFEARRGRGERAPWIPYADRVSNPFRVRTSR